MLCWGTLLVKTPQYVADQLCLVTKWFIVIISVIIWAASTTLFSVCVSYVMMSLISLDTVAARERTLLSSEYQV